MTRITRLCLTASLTTLIIMQAEAHHSAAAYDTEKEVKVTGTVKQYTYKNPHVYMMLEIPQPNGTSTPMEIEAGAPSVLNPLGFTRDSVAIGDVVTVSGNPSRNPAAHAMLGRDLYKRDGKYYPLNIGSRSVYSANAEAASSIAGTWFSPRTEFNSFLGSAGKWPVTEKGKAALAAADPKATTQKDCVPIGAPALMFYPVANTIAVQRDRVVMKVDWMESERTIFLDGRKHPPATQTSLLGHSIGHWEGETLVVETTNFKEHPMGLSMSLPSSTQKRLVERFGLSQDKKNLIYAGTIEDPVYLTKPVEWTGRWEYRPGMAHSNEKCDLNTARKFLKQ